MCYDDIRHGPRLNLKLGGLDMKEKNTRVSVLNSIRTKILLFVAFSMIVALLISMFGTIPRLRDNMTDTTKNYMTDVAWAVGHGLDREIAHSTSEEVLAAEELDIVAGDVGIEGLESSYAYIVGGDGSMLYHPTADKIGQPVENDAVKQLLAEISKGNRPESDVIEYKFNGVMKYASYYIGENLDFIVVVTVDEDEINAATNNIRNQAIVFAIIGLMVCLAVAFVITGSMVKPISNVSKAIVKMADMDFRDDGTLAAVGKKKDETGVMGRALLQMRHELIDVIQKISGQSNELHGASETMNRSANHTAESVDQVEKAINEIAQGATSQAQETQTATENVILMGDMIEDTNREIDALRDSANAMNAAGNKAIEILAQLNKCNQQTKDAIEVVYEQTNTTNTSAMKIKAATDVITEIAEETNLLSLNASIEAARAGEQGRGFAVVASQIQKLAEQSNNSAQEIAVIINELISDAAKSVETMENVRSVIKQQDEHVKTTEDSFRDVASGIAQSIDGIQSISAKTKQLNEARIRVVDVVQNLTAIAEENAAGTQETSASVTEVGNTMNDVAEEATHLNGIATALEDSVSVFKVD